MSEWAETTLGQATEIRVSNVNKKTLPGEQRVRLCNYMDIYGSTAIAASHSLMLASATRAEVERFRLCEGDVVVTKDSESPDDIAVPAYIAPGIGENVVCGYHLAILRPRYGVDGHFLSYLLRLPEVNLHFARRATGSTRYGLGMKALHSAPLRMPPLVEQRRIAEILSTLDEQIEQTEALVSKAESVLLGLRDELLAPLTKGPQSTIGYEIRTYAGGTPSRAVESYYGGDIRWVKSTECNLPEIWETEEKLTATGLKSSSAKLVPENTTLIAMYGATAGVVSFLRVSATTNQAVLAVPGGANYSEKFIHHWLIWNREKLLFLAQGSGQPNLNKSMIDDLPLPRLSRSVQEAISEVLDCQFDLIQAEKNTLAKLKFQRQGLMQDLLTGKARVLQ